MNRHELLDEIAKKRREIKELEQKLQLSTCQICGKSFVRRTTAKYCDNPCPNDPTMTCKQYGTKRLWYQGLTAVERLEKNVRAKLAMRCKRHPEDTALLEKYNAFREANKRLKALTATGVYTTEEYKKWLEEQQC